MLAQLLFLTTNKECAKQIMTPLPVGLQSEREAGENIPGTAGRTSR